MRRFLAGFLLVFVCLLFLPTLAFAQMKADVESVGFNNWYRPNCWTPLVVRLLAEKSGTYSIHVVQEDIDGDKPEYTRTITVTGTDEGATVAQRYRVYFIPQAVDKGLYDVSRGGTTKELSEQLKVFVYDSDGKQLMQLPITQQIINLEPAAPPFGTIRGERLILTVAQGGAGPIVRDYADALGLLERPEFVGLQSTDLPENVIGYEAVDSILWLNSPVPDISNPTEDQRMRAIREWVRQGGKLVICQPPQRDATLAWGDLLPVVVNEIGELPVPEPIRTMAIDGVKEYRREEVRRAWRSVNGPVRMARADAKPGTIVDAEITWDQEGKDRTPFIVRMPYGLGCVTWVAQDLSDPSITNRVKTGWPHIWDKVFDWRNDTLLKDPKMPEDLAKPLGEAGYRDIGAAMREGMAMAGKSRAYIGLAVVFFIVYWLVAGPGIFVYLAAKARAYASWFVFAATALVATAITVLLVQLVVRGPPELQHVTLIRKAAGQPAVVLSRFGLYIKHDGLQEISLADTDPLSQSYITPFADHPEQMPESSKAASAGRHYAVPIHEVGSADRVAIEVPYRSTLKKLQAKWVGDISNVIDGSAKVFYTDFNDSLSGTITNGTGQKLRNIYIAYKPLQFTDQFQRDKVIYLPSWDTGVSLDLARETDRNNGIKIIGSMGQASSNLADIPERGARVTGLIYSEAGWPAYWYEAYRVGTGLGLDSTMITDQDDSVPRSFPLLSFFDRLPPARGPKRFELLRRGGRQFDITSAVMAGQLVVLAEADNSALPIPLEVNGDRVAGTGRVYYQFVLPLDYVQLDENGQATSRPAAAASQTTATPSPGNPAPPAPVER